MAGIETTATTLQWALLYMVAYPDVQSESKKKNTVLQKSHILLKKKKNTISGCLTTRHVFCSQTHSSVSVYVHFLVFASSKAIYLVWYTSFFIMIRVKKYFIHK